MTAWALLLLQTEKPDRPANAISDALITLAYYSTPITLVYFVRKRKDLKFHWMFVCFAVFILACGMTHVMEIWNIWHSELLARPAPLKPSSKRSLRPCPRPFCFSKSSRRRWRCR